MEKFKTVCLTHACVNLKFTLSSALKLVKALKTLK